MYPKKRTDSRQGKNSSSLMRIKELKLIQNFTKQLLAKCNGKILLRLKGSIWQASMEPKY